MEHDDDFLIPGLSLIAGMGFGILILVIVIVTIAGNA